MAFLQLKSSREVVPVILDEATPGDTVRGYVLLEMDGHERDLYLKTLKERSDRVDSRGKRRKRRRPGSSPPRKKPEALSPTNTTGLVADMLNRCLWEAEIYVPSTEEADKGMEPRVSKVGPMGMEADFDPFFAGNIEPPPTVSKDVIESMPSSTQQALYLEAARINGLLKGEDLDDLDEDELGN